METNLAEDLEREKAMLVGMALEKCKRSHAGIWDEYTTKDELPVTVGSEYYDLDTVRNESGNVYYTVATVGGEAFQDIEYVSIRSVYAGLHTFFNELNFEIGQSWFTAIETEAAQLGLKIQHNQLYQEIKKIANEIDEGVFARLAGLLQSADVETIEKAMEDLMKELISDDRLKDVGILLYFLLSLSPDDANYERFQKMIAPPKFIEVRESKPIHINETISFLRREGKKFLNKWVAVSNGQLLDASNSYAEMAKRFKNDEDVIITRMV